jgi:hypothetical protein
MKHRSQSHGTGYDRHLRPIDPHERRSFLARRLHAADPHMDDGGFIASVRR